MFEKGDRVICSYGSIKGYTGIVMGRYNDACYLVDFELSVEGKSGCNTFQDGYLAVRDELLELIETKNKNNMSLKQKFNNLFTKEPQKSFRKAGITDGSDILTDDGKAVFLAWLLGKNADAFKAEVVDPILAEEAENK